MAEGVGFARGAKIAPPKSRHLTTSHSWAQGVGFAR